MTLKGEISMPDYLRVLISSADRVSRKGYLQSVKKYDIANRAMTEITTDLGMGEKGIRNIYYNLFGEIDCVVDNVYGRRAVYTRDFRKGNGVIQEIDGIKSYLPNLSMEKLAEI